MMRLTNQHPKMMCFKVFLDGEEVPFCFEADEEAGEVRCYQSRDGKVEMICDDLGFLPVGRTRQGKVEIRWVGPGRGLVGQVTIQDGNQLPYEENFDPEHDIPAETYAVYLLPDNRDWLLERIVVAEDGTCKRIRLYVPRQVILPNLEVLGNGEK